MVLLPLPNNMKVVSKVNNESDDNDLFHGEPCPHCSSDDTYQRKCDGKPYIVCDGCDAVFIPINSNIVKKSNRIVIEDKKIHLLH